MNKYVKIDVFIEVPKPTSDLNNDILPLPKTNQNNSKNAYNAIKPIYKYVWCKQCKIVSDRKRNLSMLT